MPFVDDLDALAQRHAALAADLATKREELDAAAQLLAQARARRQLSVLNVRIATPCSAEWSEMLGDDRVRACAACNKSVFDISNMTRVEAEALIVEKEGRLCLRYYQRADGTIMLKDCGIATTKSGRRYWVSLGGAAAIVAAAAVTSQGPEPQLLSPMPTRVERSAPRWRYVPERSKVPRPNEGVLLDNELHATGGVASFFANDAVGSVSLDALEGAPHRSTAPKR